MKQQQQQQYTPFLMQTKQLQSHTKLNLILNCTVRLHKVCTLFGRNTEKKLSIIKKNELKLMNKMTEYNHKHTLTFTE